MSLDGGTPCRLAESVQTERPWPRNPTLLVEKQQCWSQHHRADHKYHIFMLWNAPSHCTVYNNILLIFAISCQIHEWQTNGWCVRASVWLYSQFCLPILLCVPKHMVAAQDRTVCQNPRSPPAEHIRKFCHTHARTENQQRSSSQ